MRIYNSGSYGRGTTLVSPGAHHPEVSRWMDSKTNEPLLLSVKFENGRADVEEALGRYMIERGLAQGKAPRVTPIDAASTADVVRLERENAALREELDAQKTGRPLTFMQRLRRAL